MAILGPDGNPVSTAELNQEIAAPTQLGPRSVYREGVATGLTPESLAALLQDAAWGYGRRYLTLAEEMEERYLHYASQLQTRRLAIEAIEPVVEVPEGTPTKIADAVHGLVADPAFREMIGSLTDAVAKGYSAVELIWDYVDGLLKPVKYIWRDPRFFLPDRQTLSELRLVVDYGFEGAPLPPAKFAVHMPRSKMGVPLRRGVARAAAFAFMIQGFSLKDWVSFSEVYGMPLRIGRYPAGASQEDRRVLLRAVRDIGTDAAAIVPVGMEMEFAKVEGQHGSAVFGGLIDYVDRQVSKVVVGQTLTADEGSRGGSMAQAKVHNEVRLDIARADGRQMGTTASRDVIAPFVAFNFGPQRVYPTVSFPIAEPDDITALSNALAQLVPMGLRVKAAEIRGKLSLSDPAPDDEVLAKEAAPSPPEPIALPAPVPGGKSATLSSLAGHVTGCRCGGCLARLSADPADPADQVDDGLGLTDALLSTAADDFAEITDPLLGPLALAASKATTLDEALAIIRKRGPDGAALLEQLAIATATARGIGDVRD
jgi:phage gp29-like protein